MSRPGRPTLVAAAVCVLLALVWTLPMEAETGPGWDETMHTGLPALRIAYSVLEGHPDLSGAVLDCERYPFVFPVALATWQIIFGTGDQVARVFVTLLWCLTLFGLYLLGRELVERLGEPRPRAAALLPWAALGLGASCPLALGLAGTTFLEVPFACASVFALRAWIARGREVEGAQARRLDLIAGAWLTACFFTKFNYGILLCGGLGLDWAVQGLVALRRGEGRTFARRSLWLAAVPALALAWWFLLPLPGGLEVAAAHRHAFADWLGGNLEQNPAPWRMRTLNVTIFFAGSLRLFLLWMLGLGASLRWAARPPARALLVVLLSIALPILLHRFHLDRFLIPIGVPLWTLAALGWATLLPRSPVRAGAIAAALLALGLLFPSVDARFAAGKLGFLSDDEQVQAYQMTVLTQRLGLGGGRFVRSAGLPTGEREAFLDLVATGVGPAERVGWLGVTEEVSPIGLLHGLAERDGSRARFLEQAPEKNFVSIEDFDPQWSDEQLRDFASLFDVLVASDPPHMRGKPSREWLAAYRQRLLTLGWTERELGTLAFARPLREPLKTRVLLLRPPQPR